MVKDKVTIAPQFEYHKKDLPRIYYDNFIQSMIINNDELVGDGDPYTIHTFQYNSPLSEQLGFTNEQMQTPTKKMIAERQIPLKKNTPSIYVHCDILEE